MVIRTLLDTSRESTTSYARHAVWDGNRSQAAAIIESLVSYARHAVWDGNRSQATAKIESPFSYARHAVRYN